MSTEYIMRNPRIREALLSDLALERRRADTDIDGIDYRRERGDIGVWERISVTSDEGERSIGRPKGEYNTLTLPRMDTLDGEEGDDAANEIARELCRMLDRCGVTPERLLVVGLGNRHLSPDAVGPECADGVRATMHIKALDEDAFYELECSEIAVITPGVMHTSGLCSTDVVKGVCDIIHPSLVIAVDALAAGSAKRLGTTVQLCNTGIFPGSGLGNRHKGLTRETLGAPVIAIGIPTVINSRMLVLEDGEVRAPERQEGMFLAPKEINEIVTNAARIVSQGINQAFGYAL